MSSREESRGPLRQAEAGRERLGEEGEVPGRAGQVHGVSDAEAGRVRHLHQQVGLANAAAATNTNTKSAYSSG